MNAIAQPASPTGGATIVLVHGAFADASSWNGIIKRLSGWVLRCSRSIRLGGMPFTSGMPDGRCHGAGPDTWCPGLIRR